MASFCECGSLIIDNKCTNKKCGKMHLGTTQFELKIFDILDRINNPEGKINDIEKIKIYDGAYPTDRDFFADDADLNINFKTIKKLGINPTVSVCNNDSSGGLALNKIQEITPNQAKGKLTKITPIIIRFNLSWLESHKPGRYGYGDVATYYWGSYDGMNFIPIDHGGVNVTGKGMFEFNEYFRWFIGLMHLEYNWWTVYLKDENDIVGIKIPVEPSALKKLFKLREMEAGKERRTALKHWVAEHYRRKNDNSNEEGYTFINQYLRGATEFNWSGLYCKITPSIKDREILTKTKESKAL